MDSNETIAPFFNMSLDKYLETTLGPKHLALSTVIPLTVVLVLIFIAGVMGNVCVCLVIIRNSSLHTATNYYLFSLAVSDLTLLMLGLPNDLGLYWQQYPWTLGVGLCKLRAFVSEMGSYTSVLTIVAFSMERYLAICHPLHHYTMSGLQRAVKIIAVLWLISFAGAAPFAVFTTVNYLQYPPGSGHEVVESGFCGLLEANLPPNWPIYELSCAIFFLLPMIVILILYIRMGVKIRKRANRRSLSRRIEGSVHEKRHSSSRKAVIRMLAAVVIAFFLCWAPFHAQRLIYLYAKNWPHFNELNEWIYHIAGCFYYFSSTVNPVLYNVMSAKYRLAFRETLCGLSTTQATNLHMDDSLSRTRNSLRHSNPFHGEQKHLIEPGKPAVDVVLIAPSTKSSLTWPKIFLRAVSKAEEDRGHSGKGDSSQETDVDSGSAVRWT